MNEPRAANTGASKETERRLRTNFHPLKSHINILYTRKNNIPKSQSDSVRNVRDKTQRDDAKKVIGDRDICTCLASRTGLVLANSTRCARNDVVGKRADGDGNRCNQKRPIGGCADTMTFYSYTPLTLICRRYFSDSARGRFDPG